MIIKILDLLWCIKLIIMRVGNIIRKVIFTSKELGKLTFVYLEKEIMHTEKNDI